MKNVLLVLSLFLFACSKDKDTDQDNHRKMTVSVVDHVPPGIGNHYWGVNVVFSDPVTLKGEIDVTFDVYDSGAKVESHAVTAAIDITRASSQIYNTRIDRRYAVAEIKNVKVTRFDLTEGDYHIEY